MQSDALEGVERLESYFALSCGAVGAEGGGDECRPGELGNGKLIVYLNEMLFVGRNRNNYRVCLTTSLPLALVERTKYEEALETETPETEEKESETQKEKEEEEKTLEVSTYDVDESLELVLCNKEDLSARRPAAQSVLEFAIRSWKDMPFVPFQRSQSRGCLMLANLHVAAMQEELRYLLRAAIAVTQKHRAGEAPTTFYDHLAGLTDAGDARVGGSGEAGSGREGEKRMEVLFGGSVAVKGAAVGSKSFMPENLEADIDVALVLGAAPEAYVFSLDTSAIVREEYRSKEMLDLEVELALSVTQNGDGSYATPLQGKMRVRCAGPGKEKTEKETAFVMASGSEDVVADKSLDMAALVEHWSASDRIRVLKAEGSGQQDSEAALAAARGEEPITVQTLQQQILKRQAVLQQQQVLVHLEGDDLTEAALLHKEVGVNVELGHYFSRR